MGRVAQGTHPVLWEVSRNTLNAPVLAADFNGTPDNLPLGTAFALNRHEEVVVARSARLPVCARSTLHITLDTGPLVAVEAVVAHATPAVRRIDAALPGQRAAVVARVVRQEHPRVDIACRAERRVERTRRAQVTACCR